MNYVYSKQSPYLGGGVGSGDGGGCVWGGRREREVKDPTIMAQKLQGFAHYGKFKVQTSIVQFSFKKKFFVGFWYYLVI
jgi:hypothetical protein